jgi:hypothetical protein
VALRALVRFVQWTCTGQRPFAEGIRRAEDESGAFIDDQRRA